MTQLAAFETAIRACRGNHPLTRAERAVLDNPPPGVNVDSVASILDGYLGADARSYAAWMADRHADRLQTFHAIRAAMHGRRVPTGHDVSRLADDLRLLHGVTPSDMCNALGLNDGVSPAMAADRFEALMRDRANERSARRSEGSVRTIYAREGGAI